MFDLSIVSCMNWSAYSLFYYIQYISHTGELGAWSLLYNGNNVVKASLSDCRLNVC